MDTAFDARLSTTGTGPGSDDDGAPLADGIVRDAVAWYVQMASGSQTRAQHVDFERWHGRHPDHARAWRRLQTMGGLMQGGSVRTDPDVARTALIRAAVVPARRRAFKSLIWVGAGGAAVCVAHTQLPWRQQLAGALADVRTATGERRDMVLADGTRLMLNTASAVDIRFDATARRVVLLRGEIMVTTARDAAGRPFVVETDEGSLTPVGTRFSVRRDDGAMPGASACSRLAVSEGAVRVRAAQRMEPQPVLITAGWQVRFQRDHIEAPTPLREADLSWTDGTLVAEGARLADFIADLDRYRPGRLRCAPEAANLRITGAWPLDGLDPTERILESLERRLPVTVVRRTRYWVTVAARGS